MSHTPTPWEVMQPSQDTDDVIEIRSTINGWTVARMGDGDLIDEQDHDNAAHIVHCVNAYPQLVEALQRCIAALAANGAPNCEAVKEAKAALAAAEKGA